MRRLSSSENLLSSVAVYVAKPVVVDLQPWAGWSLAVADGDQSGDESSGREERRDLEGRAESRGQRTVHGTVSERARGQLSSRHRRCDGAHDRDAQRAAQLPAGIQKGRGQAGFTRVDPRDRGGTG